MADQRSRGKGYMEEADKVRTHVCVSVCGYVRDGSWAVMDGLAASHGRRAHTPLLHSQTRPDQPGPEAVRALQPEPKVRGRGGGLHQGRQLFQGESSTGGQPTARFDRLPPSIATLKAPLALPPKFQQVAKAWPEAAEAFSKAVDLHVKLGSTYDAANAAQEAANCFKNVSG